MRKIFIIFLAFLLNACASLQIKRDNVKNNLEYEYSNGKYIVLNKYIFKEDSHIMIKFNIETPEKINFIESKYDLIIVEVLVNGYYIYKTNVNTIDKINSLIDEKNIKTVIPEWNKFFNKK